jgi:hypothetical protein
MSIPEGVCFDAFRRALIRILNYMEHDERKDYECRDEADRRDHIYESVKVIQAWLDARGGMT